MSDRRGTDDAADRGLSVLLVARGRAGELQRALASVAAHLPSARVRVWVDRSHADAETRALAAAFETVDWTFPPDDHGGSRAVNRMAARDDNDLLLLRPDVTVTSGLTRSLAALADGRVAAAAPLVAGAAELRRPWDVARRRQTTVRLLVERAGYSERLRGTPLSDRYRAAPSAVDGYLAEYGLLVARAAWAEVGEFDELVGLAEGATHWQLRAVAAGWGLRLVDEPGLQRHLDPADPPADPAVADQLADDLHLAHRAFALGIIGNGGPGARVTAGDLLLERVQPARRRTRAAARAGRAARSRGLPHVVITTNKLAIGGAERQRVTMANELVRRGHPVTLVCLQRLGHLQTEVDPEVRVVVRPWWQPLVDDVGDEAVLVSGSTNIATGFALGWSRAGGRRTRRRWLVAAHDPPKPGTTYSAPLARAMSRSDGIIALSERHWQELTAAQHLHDRHFCVPNGVEARDDRGYHPHRPLRLAFLGRVVEHKNPHLLVAALGELRDMDWELDIFGHGPDLERLQATTPADLRDRVRWRGHVAGPDTALAEADVLCCPSGHEAFPLVVLEGMARGVPVMASAVCAVPEMIDDGRAGVLVPEATVQAWVAALKPVLDDPESLRGVARAGFERMRELYTIEAMVDGYQRVIREVLA